MRTMGLMIGPELDLTRWVGVFSLSFLIHARTIKPFRTVFDLGLARIRFSCLLSLFFYLALGFLFRRRTFNIRLPLACFFHDSRMISFFCLLTLSRPLPTHRTLTTRSLFFLSSLLSLDLYVYV